MDEAVPGDAVDLPGHGGAVVLGRQGGDGGHGGALHPGVDVTTIIIFTHHIVKA